MNATNTESTDGGDVTRLRDARSTEDLRAMENTDMPFELQLFTVAFFAIMLHLCLAPFTAVATGSLISAVYIWSLRGAAVLIFLGILQSVVRLF